MQWLAHPYKPLRIVHGNSGGKIKNGVRRLHPLACMGRVQIVVVQEAAVWDEALLESATRSDSIETFAQKL